MPSWVKIVPRVGKNRSGGGDFRARKPKEFPPLGNFSSTPLSIIYTTAYSGRVKQFSINTVANSVARAVSDKQYSWWTGACVLGINTFNAVDMTRTWTWPWPKRCKYIFLQFYRTNCFIRLENGGNIFHFGKSWKAKISCLAFLGRQGRLKLEKLLNSIFILLKKLHDANKLRDS